MIDFDNFGTTIPYRTGHRKEKRLKVAYSS